MLVQQTFFLSLVAEEAVVLMKALVLVAEAEEVLEHSLISLLLLKLMLLLLVLVELRELEAHQTLVMLDMQRQLTVEIAQL